MGIQCFHFEVKHLLEHLKIFYCNNKEILLNITYYQDILHVENYTFSYNDRYVNLKYIFYKIILIKINS